MNNNTHKNGNALVIVLVVVLLLCCCCFSIIGGFFYLVTNNTKIGNSVVDSWIDGYRTQMYPNQTTPQTGTTNPTPTSTSSDDDVSGRKLPSDFPSDVPVFTQASIEYASSTDGNVYAIFTTTAPIQDVVDFYSTEMVKEGWDKGDEITYMGTIITFTKDDREVMFSAYEDTATDSGLVSFQLEIQ